MSKHTPGPWSVHPMAPTAVHQPELGCWIPQSEADARLIAAAPELLEALREAADYTRHPDYDWPVEFSRRVSAAIAKADGKP